jgi:tripartite-type tricarboxylate transporter receptor subunit TctC
MPCNTCDRFHYLRAPALGLLIGLATALPLAPAYAEDAGAFLKGQTVQFYVGYHAGGGYDTYARLLAPHFEKATGATVVVVNKPGGGGTTSLNQLVRAKPDGLTMQILNGEGMIMAQLIKKPGVAFDMTKISYLGRIAEEPHFLLVNPKLPDSLKEIIASGKKLKFSANSRVDNLGDYAAIMCEALKMKCQIVTGYKGSKGASLAMFNGEVDGLTISEGSGNRYAAGGKAKVIAVLGHKRSKLKPDVPTVYEMFKLTPEQKWWFDFRFGIKAIGRDVVGPPGIPADRLAYLRKVWKDILTDPKVIAEGKKRKRGFDYAPAAQLEKTAKEILGSLKGDKLKSVKEVLLKKFSS